jgi:hypothetical protein
MTETSIHPADIVMNLIVAFLTPMFLATTGGDLSYARAAAIETVNAYTARNPADLLLIGQSIALGLAVLSSIGLSMAENIPINLILRLRGNAVSLHRASDRCRRAVPEPIAAPAKEAPLSDIDLQLEEETIAEVARTRQRVNDYQASLARRQDALPPAARTAPATDNLPPPEYPDSPATMKAAMAALLADSERRISEADAAMKATGQPIPKAAPHQAPPRQAPTTEDEDFRSAWSSAMADVADEMTAEIANLPPNERKAAGIRVDALNATAKQLTSGAPAPPARAEPGTADHTDSAPKHPSFQRRF